MKKALYTRPLTIAVSQEVYAQVKRITDKKDLSMAEYVREIIDRELAREKKEASEDLGITPCSSRI